MSVIIRLNRTQRGSEPQNPKHVTVRQNCLFERAITAGKEAQPGRESSRRDRPGEYILESSKHTVWKPSPQMGARGEGSWLNNAISGGKISHQAEQGGERLRTNVRCKEYLVSQRNSVKCIRWANGIKVIQAKATNFREIQMNSNKC